jgi:hypothetical protein
VAGEAASAFPYLTVFAAMSRRVNVRGAGHFSPEGRYMRKLLLAVVAAASATLAVQAYACDEASVEHVSSTGAIIELDDGTTWEVSPGDRATVSTWEGDDVLVCDDKMINKSDGETVHVTER